MQFGEVFLELVLATRDTWNGVQVRHEEAVKALVGHRAKGTVDRMSLLLAVLLDQQVIVNHRESGLGNGIEKTAVLFTLNPDHEPSPHSLYLQQVFNIQFVYADLIAKKLLDARSFGRPFSVGVAVDITRNQD
ncbi:hypothetical protein SBA6_1080003 [Candidatus Sulfopaludibacter sp. SbA6]|nr:hypothetical protein SBA6_1080003 [Candidatus Sulfopaludibacter sp. SbA6]